MTEDDNAIRARLALIESFEGMQRKNAEEQSKAWDKESNKWKVPLRKVASKSWQSLTDPQKKSFQKLHPHYKGHTNSWDKATKPTAAHHKSAANWWAKLSLEQRKQYLADHPRSKLAAIKK